MHTITFHNELGVQRLAEAGDKDHLCQSYSPPLGEQLVQAEDFPGGEQMVFIARGNIQNVIRFRVRRGFDDRESAHLFTHVHAQNLRGRGEFVSIVEGRRVAGEDFVMRILGMEVNGIEVIIDYEAMGGLLSEKAE